MSISPLISVCIPVYNSDVTSLIFTLSDQISFLENKLEIIVIDDFSQPEWKVKNERIYEFCTYIELDENIGRSKIRNLFLKFSKGNFLLFIDGDSEVINSNYLLNYIQFIVNNNVDVLVGGSVYQTEKPPRKYRLRWDYSIRRESKTAEQRKSGKIAFKTNNFIIKRTILERNLFDDRLQGYGHEDTLFGFDLKRQKTTIDHLENPVLNRHLDSNDVFLDKTENAIGNLVMLYSLKEQYPEIINIKLIRFYERLNKFKFVSLFMVIYFLINPILKRFLSKGYFMLWMFDFYKLGLFIRKIKL